MNKVLLVLGGFLLASSYVSAMEGPTEPTDMYRYLKKGFPNLSENEFWDCYIETGGDYDLMVGALKTREYNGREGHMPSPYHPEPYHGSYPSSSSAYSHHPYKSDERYSPLSFSPPINRYDGHHSSSSSPHSSQTISLSSPRIIESKGEEFSSKSLLFPRETKSEFRDEYPPVIQLIYNNLAQKMSEVINDCIDQGKELPLFPTKDGGYVQEPTNAAYIISFEHILKKVNLDYLEKQKIYDTAMQELVNMQLRIKKQQQTIESKPLSPNDTSSPLNIDEPLNTIHLLNLMYEEQMNNLIILKKELTEMEENQMHIKDHLRYLEEKEK